MSTEQQVKKIIRASDDADSAIEAIARLSLSKEEFRRAQRKAEKRLDYKSKIEEDRIAEEGRSKR
jgi:hypothetical protein